MNANLEIYNLANDMYVVIAENDQTHKYEDGMTFKDEKGPVIMEQYVRESSLEEASQFARELESDGNYGKCRIAKLVFIDNEEEIK